MQTALRGLLTHRPATWKHAAGLLCLLAGALTTTGCSATPTQTYEIRQRAYTYEPNRAATDYAEEYEYIATRRRMMAGGHVGPPPTDTAPLTTPPPNLTGLAFSGGGIRSATFHLGLLQALQDMGRLSQMDYLSTVSGGSYIAGWLAGHLGSEVYDEYGNLVRTTRLNRLLDPGEDFVAHLRHHSGFLREDGFWEGPALLWGYLWRLPIHLVWDVALHLKTTPSFNNFIHLFTQYQRRVEITYLRGQPDRGLTALQRARHVGPYLILNGNLVNRGRPRNFSTTDARPYRDNYNFEFTPHYTGSDGLGYVETAGFGLPVVRALDEQRESAVLNPRFVEVETPEEDACRVRSRLRFRPDACFRLSEAMTASGAGLNVASLRGEWVKDDIGRTLIGAAFSPFNFNNQFEAWNFARRWNGLFGTIWDYARMVTIERLFPNTESRWLEISDGSFYDNLGAQTLLRRDVTHLVLGDATLDPTWNYHYLHNLQRRVREYFGQGVQWCGDIPAEGTVAWYRRFWIRRPSTDGTPGALSLVHYLKPFVANPRLLTRTHWFGPSDHLLIAAPEAGPHGADAAPWEADRQPGHLDVDYLLSLTSDPRVREELIDGVRKVSHFAATDKAGDFPQTETLVQWFTLEEFEAYRYLGYLMGWAYVSQIDFSDASLVPTAPCIPLE